MSVATVTPPDAKDAVKTETAALTACVAAHTGILRDVCSIVAQYVNAPIVQFHIPRSHGMVLVHALRIAPASQPHATSSNSCTLSDDCERLSLYDPPTAWKQEPYQFDASMRRLDAVYDIFSRVKDLVLYSNSLFALPPSIRRFSALVSIRVSGSRWWNLNMSQLPASVEQVSFLEMSSSSDVLVGMDGLSRLAHLHLDECYLPHPEHEEYWKATPIADLPSLCTVSVPNPPDGRHPVVQAKTLVQHSSFANIAYRIQSAWLHHDTLNTTLVTLRAHPAASARASANSGFQVPSAGCSQ